MVKYRTVVAYKHYFEEFLDAQIPKVQAKILQIMRIIEEIEIIPENHLKYIEGTDGLIYKAVKLMDEYYKEKEDNI